MSEIPDDTLRPGSGGGGQSCRSLGRKLGQSINPHTTLHGNGLSSFGQVCFDKEAFDLSQERHKILGDMLWKKKSIIFLVAVYSNDKLRGLFHDNIS